MSELGDFDDEFEDRHVGRRSAAFLGRCSHVMLTRKRCKMWAQQEAFDGRAYCRHHIPHCEEV